MTASLSLRRYGVDDPKKVKSKKHRYKKGQAILWRNEPGHIDSIEGNTAWVAFEADPYLLHPIPILDLTPMTDGRGWG